MEQIKITKIKNFFSSSFTCSFGRMLRSLIEECWACGNALEDKTAIVPDQFVLFKPGRINQNGNDQMLNILGVEKEEKKNNYRVYAIIQNLCFKMASEKHALAQFMVRRGSAFHLSCWC